MKQHSIMMQYRSNFMLRTIIIMALSIVFVPNNTALAQNASVRKIHGIVVSHSQNQILEAATIITLPDSMISFADGNGTFDLPIYNTTEKIVVKYTGYINDTIFVANIVDTVMVKLVENITEKTLNDAVVQTRKNSTEISTIGIQKVEKIGHRELLKAACCNLSESFETTPSVDVGFTDAVSGYKQIQMLGLTGSHTMFTRENIPDTRGLAAITGLTFTPGTWVESMQLSKGTGSVVNGYEGTAGQINVEWLKPFEEKMPRMIINGYQSTQGRSEGNLIYNHNFDETISTNIFLHGKSNWMRVDQNNDGFLDQPIGNTFAAANRWFYFSPKGFEIQGGIKGVYMDNTGGQNAFADTKQQTPLGPWGYLQNVERIEGWAKLGKMFTAKPYKSMGLQLSALHHNQNTTFGLNHFDALQQSLYANYIYQTIISNTDHIIKGGASFTYDVYKEMFGSNNFNRKEIVPGAFAEYAYSYLKKINLVAGLRADYHNLFGFFATPRMHIRYAPNDFTAFRASIGRAQRTANIFAENFAYMASNRTFLIESANPFNNAYGFKPEVAWNMGINTTQKFRLNYRDGTFGIDYYYTNFTNQVVVDIENPHSVRFYNLIGKSFAHSFQAQLDYEPIRKLDVRLAYRWYNVKTTYDALSIQNGILKQKPLLAAHRAFANIAYETNNNWTFDYTIHWTGAKRVPLHSVDGINYKNFNASPFTIMNAQISKSWKKETFHLYAGVENIMGVMQHHLVLGADNPYSNYFDASIIWGAAMGRNIYVGFNYRLK